MKYEERLEFCYELSWKALRDYLKEKGLICNSPRDVFQSAFQYGLITDDPQWLEMIEDRNLTAHTYEEKLADDIYDRLEGYLRLYRELLGK